MSENAIIITAPSQLLQDLKDECFGLLDTEADAKQDFKTKIEDFAKDYNIDKKVLTKYMKALHQDKIKEAQSLGKAFAALDEAMG